jgi:DNA-binding response OmpR family regulator
MDAPEVLTRLAEDAACRELPVLVLSQMDWVQDKARSLAAGARAFRVKPSDLDELRALVVEFWRDVAV